MAALSEKRKRSNKKWDDAHLRRYTLAIPIDLYNKLSTWAKLRNVSINSLVRELIEKNLPDGIRTMETPADQGASGELSQEEIEAIFEQMQQKMDAWPQSGDVRG